MANITFAVSFIECLDPNVKGSYVKFGIDPSQLMTYLFRSAQHFHPGAQCVVLTDQHTKFKFIDPVEIIRYDLDPNCLYYSLFKTKVSYLATHDFSSHLVLLDYDMLINASLFSLFEEAFDVGLTYRPNHEWPINGGIQFVHAHSKQASQHYFQAVFKHLEALPEEKKQWWGDQIALYAVIEDSYRSRTSENLLYNSTRIRLLPCETYNYYFPRVFKSVQEESEGKVVLHFKGNRKQFMAKFFDYIMR